jgi:serine/threonine-protein kinase
VSGPRTVQILLPIADALATAHGQGIVHRDVKPENVFIAEDDLGRLQPKLLDFGIAQRVDADRRLTAKGAVIGTPGYLSPEQARGESTVDARADIWAFCVMIYECVTGKLPFEGDNYNALLNAIINAEPIPMTSLAAGDADLWRLVASGLRKRPEERWESMRALGEALALWGYERGVREDISAASLRTSWLEADFAEVKVDLASDPPTASPPTLSPPAPAPAAAAPVAASARESQRARRAVTVKVVRSMPPRRRMWVVAALALLAAVAGSVILVIALRRSSAVEPGVEAVEPRPADEPRQEPAPVATVRVLSSPAPPSPTPEPSVSAVVAPIGKVKTSPPAAGAAGRPTTKPKGKPAPDFGF